MKKLRELGSLVSATFIVLSVCGVALASMSGAKVAIPAPIRAAFIRPMLERNVQAHLSAMGLTKPVVCVASVEMHGWRTRGDRVADLTVITAREEGAALSVDAGSVSPSGALVASLKGRRVFVSVSEAALDALPTRGAAAVRLVAVPQGETVGLVVDSVIRGSSGSTSLTIASAPDVPSPAGALAVPLPHVGGLSRYYGRPGTRITITGSAFGASAGTGYVVCSGVRAQVDSWSDSAITFTVPAGAKRPGYVGVSANGRSSNGIYFIPSERPTVASISPREGAPGTVVTIEGSGFGADQGTGWVSFAGVSGQVVEWTDTRVRVTVPAAAVAGWTGVVTNGLSSNGVLYGPYGLPFVSSLSSQRLSRGDSVTLRGRDFGAEPGSVIIGRARVSADSWTDSAITFTVPAGVSSGFIGVLRDDLYTSNGWWVNLVPRVSDVSGWWARPGGELTLSGTGFGSSPGEYFVTVGKVPVPSGDVVSWSDTSIRVRVPASAPTGYVGVGTIAATSNGIHLVVETPAQVSSVSPRTAGPGDTITVTGSGFGASGGPGRVLIGGAHEAEIVSWSDSSAVVRVPAGATSGYVGVIKQNVSSNGVWLSVAP